LGGAVTAGSPGPERTNMEVLLSNIVQADAVTLSRLLQQTLAEAVFPPADVNLPFFPLNHRSLDFPNANRKHSFNIQLPVRIFRFLPNGLRLHIVYGSIVIIISWNLKAI